VSSRAEAVATLEEGWAKLDALFARLSDQAMERPLTIGGGDWSAKDLLGHMAFWEELALDAIEAQGAGRRPRVAELFGAGGSQAAVDRANADNQARNAAMPLAAARERAATVHRALVDSIRALSDEEWAAGPTFETQRQESLGVRVGGITGGPESRPFAHAWAHLADLEAFAAS
jgi:hypothetical protein